MSEQFETALKLALDAYKASNEEETISFCNQALTINPNSSDVKLLKGAAVLISFSIAGAVNDAEEALSIWESVQNDGSVSEDMKNLAIDAAFDFSYRWYNAIRNFADESTTRIARVAATTYFDAHDVMRATENEKEVSQVEQNITIFMRSFSDINIFNTCKYMYEVGSNLVSKYKANGDMKNTNRFLSWFISLCSTKANNNDEIGRIAQSVIENNNQLVAKKKKKKYIIIGIIIALVIIGFIGNQVGW